MGALWCIVFSRFCENIKRITKTYPTNIKQNQTNIKKVILKQQAKSRKAQQLQTNIQTISTNVSGNKVKLKNTEILNKYA